MRGCNQQITSQGNRKRPELRLSVQNGIRFNGKSACVYFAYRVAGVCCLATQIRFRAPTYKLTMAARAGRLEGKVALVTRGGYGFGAGIVSKFIEEGAKVLIVDHSVSHGKEVAAEHSKGTAVFCRADPTKAEDWKKAVDTAVQTFGHLDIVVNHAGAVHRMMVRPTSNTANTALTSTT